MSKATKGINNANYGNYWTDEQKQKLSELRISNGKSKGELNGMFGKKGDKAINGKRMVDTVLQNIKILNNGI